jgi:hypothetical protein
MAQFCIEAYDDYMSAQQKCNIWYKVICTLFISCIIMIPCGIAGILYYNDTLGMISLSLGISMAFILLFGLIIVLIGACIRCREREIDSPC